MTAIALPLRGPAGEPVDFWRTINSHGMGDLHPLRVPDAGDVLEATVALAHRRPRRITVRDGGDGTARITVAGDPPDAAEQAAVRDAVAHILRLDADLSGLYALVAGDPGLGWAAAGAGRLTRSQTVFEDVIKTICTTNCAWSATVRMVDALVANLGEAAADAPENGPAGRVFPTPAALAAMPDAFFKETVRAGYRGPYLRAIAERVASGDLDLEAWGRATPEELPDADLSRLLVALPGIGPYAAAHIMMMLGRTAPLVLDSWTRPTYARVTGASVPVPDAEIAARFARYGAWAGLAFWLTVTRPWADQRPAGGA